MTKPNLTKLQHCGHSLGRNLRSTRSTLQPNLLKVKLAQFSQLQIMSYMSCIYTLIIFSSLCLSTPSLGTSSVPSLLTLTDMDESPPQYTHHPRPEFENISGVWGYVLRLLGEGLVVEGAIETMMWAINTPCILMCEITQQQRQIRDIRLAQYQAIDMMDGKEDGLYNGVLVGFTAEWENRDRRLEQAVLFTHPATHPATHPTTHPAEAPPHNDK